MAISEPLAIDGGRPVIPEGPPSWPLDDDDVRAAIHAAIADGSWGCYHGPHVERLASLLAELQDVPFVLPCCSGTFAVELALRGLGVGAGDEVILAGYDFSGNFRAIEAVGARPVLVDLVPGDWQMDARQIDLAAGPQTRAVIVSHLHGGVADMALVCERAAAHGLDVIEDACQTPGATVQGRAAGTWGDVGVLSFGGSKLLTAGRGGALLTRRQDCYQRAKAFCEQGNNAFPLSELQAAALVPQVPKLAERNRRREELARQLVHLCQDVAALRPATNAVAQSHPAYYKLGWFFEPPQGGGWTRDDFTAAARAEGVALDTGFRGFTRRLRRCRRPVELNQAEHAAAVTVLLHHPVLLTNTQQIELVARALRKVAHAAAEVRSGQRTRPG